MQEGCHHLISAADTGYTKVCGACAGRWADDPGLVGRGRAVDWEFCVGCIAKGKDKQVAREATCKSVHHFDEGKVPRIRRKRKRTRNGKIVRPAT